MVCTRMPCAAALTLALLATDAWCDVDLDAQNGDVIFASIEKAGSVDAYHFDVPDGVTTLHVATKSRLGPALAVTVDDHYGQLAAGIPGHAVFLDATVNNTGEYVVHVAAQDGVSTGPYRLEVSWRRTPILDGYVSLYPASRGDTYFYGARGETAEISVIGYSTTRARLDSIEDAYSGDTPRYLGGRRASVTFDTSARYRLWVVDLDATKAPSNAGARVAIRFRHAHRRLRLTKQLLPDGAQVKNIVFARPQEEAVAWVLLGEAAGSRVIVRRGSLLRPATLLTGSAGSVTPGVPELKSISPPLFFGADHLVFGVNGNARITIPLDASAGPDVLPRAFVRGSDGSVAEVDGVSISEYVAGQPRYAAFRTVRTGTFQVFQDPQSRVTLAATDDVIAVGSPSQAVDGHPWAGSVRVLARDGTTWTEETVLQSPAPADREAFGASVAISQDTLVVGAPHLPGANGVEARGAAFVYVRGADHQWTLQATLGPSESGFVADDFGAAVAIEGDTAVVACPTLAGGDGLDQAWTYFFERSGRDWTLTQRLAGSGSRLALSGDTLLLPDGDGAQVLVRADGSWTSQAYLQRSGPVFSTGEADPFSSFHRAPLSSIAIDGDMAVLGSTEDDYGYGQGTGGALGAAWVFSRTGTTWTQRAVLKPPADQFPYTQPPHFYTRRFGASVAVRAGRILVGAPLARAAYLFVDYGAAVPRFFDRTVQAQQNFSGLFYGAAVALTPSGDTAVLGEPSTSEAAEIDLQ